jgi:hypothetical protein
MLDSLPGEKEIISPGDNSASILLYSELRALAMQYRPFNVIPPSDRFRTRTLELLLYRYSLSHEGYRRCCQSTTTPQGTMLPLSGRIGWEFSS